MIRELGRPGDLGWVIQAHGELYAAEYGFDTRFEALVAQIVASYAAGHDPAREKAWIAEVDGARAGCVFCVDAGKADPGEDDTAVLRLLLVTPAARGLGLGGALVDTCLSFARAAGYKRIRLWTTDPLVAARHIYLSRGFKLVDSAPHDGFGVALVGQTYASDL
ncbi:MAG TPA: GNAT family N-acetyltransferase [Actinoplanes sp.]|jgi:GNAT superfamily N-acetyltransferase